VDMKINFLRMVSSSQIRGPCWASEAHVDRRMAVVELLVLFLLMVPCDKVGDN
jgi:hypothetical protein